MAQEKYEFKYDIKRGVVLAVDAVLLGIQDKKMKVLLIKLEKGDFAGRWALPGGFVQVDESIEDAAKRALTQKAGIKNTYLEQLYTFGDLSRDARGRIVSTVYYALVDAQKLIKLKEKTHEASWFDVCDLPLLAYDHLKIIKKAINRLKIKIQYTNISANLLPDEFTLSELQEIYEIVLRKKLDKRNFRKRILSLGLIKSVARRASREAYRPAQLYRFINKKIVYLDNLAIYR